MGKGQKDLGGFRGYVLSTDPFILWTGDAVNIEPIQKEIRNKRAVFIISIWWTAETLSRVVRLASQNLYRRKAYPYHKFIFLCNSYAEESVLRKVGLDARFCHQNATIDENIFYIQQCEKKYDALYDAQIAEFKRHYLCSNIDRLSFISYIESKNFEKKYTHSFERKFQKAHWVNNPFDGFERSFMSPEKVAIAYNQAKTGLCLSKIEGAMFASVQYLLCGLPVVNVKNMGGRDFFLDEDVSVLVTANSKSVAEGVKYLINSKILPQRIRELTLQKIYKQRQIYREILMEIFDDLGVNYGGNDLWDEYFIHKMFKFISYQDVISSIK